MKKKLLMMAMALVSLTIICACGDDGDDNGGGSDSKGVVTLTPPPYVDVATILNIKEANAENISQLRMMESGAYMITRSGSSSTRAGSPNTYEFGKFSYSGGKYIFDNGMTITATPSGQNYDVSIEWKNGTTIKTTGYLDTSSSVQAGVMTNNLCSRRWVIERVIASGTFEGTTLGKEFKGPVDLAKVKAWYEENFGTLKDKFDANTIIEGIYFDSKGLFAINYQNRNSDVGVWRWQNMTSGKLIYSWNDKMTAISFFTGDASVSFETNPETCKLILAGNVNGTDLEFKFFLH